MHTTHDHAGAVRLLHLAIHKHREVVAQMEHLAGLPLADLAPVIEEKAHWIKDAMAEIGRMAERARGFTPDPLLGADEQDRQMAALQSVWEGFASGGDEFEAAHSRLMAHAKPIFRKARQ